MSAHPWVHYGRGASGVGGVSSKNTRRIAANDRSTHVAWARRLRGEVFGEQRCRGHIHRERLNHIRSTGWSKERCLNGGGVSRAWVEGVLEGGFGRAELGDVLLEFGALAAVFDEEALIPFVGDLHLLNHNIMFSFEKCDLVREYVICGRGMARASNCAERSTVIVASCVFVHWCCVVRRMYSVESSACVCTTCSWSWRHVV